MAIMIVYDLWDNELFRCYVPAVRHSTLGVSVIDRVAGWLFDKRRVGGVSVLYITE